MEMTQISQGRTAEIFDLGNNRIMKLFRKDFPQPAIETEHRIADAINECRLPVPKFYGRAEALGRIGLIYEYIEGNTMIKCITRKPWLLFAYAKRMAACHAALHQTMVNGLPRRREQLATFIGRTDLLTDAEKHHILDELQHLPDGEALCHGDLHPDNIIFAADKPIVIDWMTGASGDPAADVARTIVLLKLGKMPRYFPLSTRIMADLCKAVLCHAYLAHYLKLTAMDRRAIRRWLLPTAAARLYENVSPEVNAVLRRFIRRELAKRHGRNGEGDLH